MGCHPAAPLAETPVASPGHPVRLEIFSQEGQKDRRMLGAKNASTIALRPTDS